MYQAVGISMSDKKKALVNNRLAKRLRHYRLASYADYFNLILSEQHPEEKQVLVDLLTTNETYFFREPKHYDYLVQHILPQFHGRSPFKVWSAACSNGSEPFTLGMVLQRHLGPGRWNILGTDINSEVIDIARDGLYPIEAAERIPREYLLEYCWKGRDKMEGVLLMDKAIRNAISFRNLNLNADFPANLGTFDLIMLRNVMIYFDQPTKQALINKLVHLLKPNAYIIVGLSESISGFHPRLKMISPSIYRLLA